MPDHSPLLALPYIQPSQAQKHVTHNEALQRLDAIVQLCVEGFAQTQPPALPEEGLVFALGTAPTGVWSGQDNTLAVFQNGAWGFVTPRPGWRAFGHEDNSLRIWTGEAWEPPRPQLNNLEHIGIATTANETNRLAVASEATLLSHEGAGHHLKINKATEAETASLLFQNGWSGRAEMGVVGNDNFSIKVSPDGTTWQTGLSINAATAQVLTQELTITGGLSLGGHAPENRLAAYESGTYSPALLDMSGNSVSLAPKKIPYIRIGDQVSLFFNFMSNLDTTGLVAGDEIAVSLPFVNGAHSFSSVELGGPVGTAGPYHWYATSGQAYARIRSLNTHSLITVSDFTAGATDIVGGTLVISLV